MDGFFKKFSVNKDIVNIVVDEEDEEEENEDNIFQEDDEMDNHLGATGGDYSASGTSKAYLPRGSVEIKTEITDYVYKPDGQFDEIKISTTMTVYQAFVRAAEKSFLKSVENDKVWSDEAIISELMFQTPFCNLPEPYLRRRVKAGWKILVARARQMEANAFKTGMGDLGPHRKSTHDDLMDEKVMDIIQRSTVHNKRLAANLAKLKGRANLGIKNKDNVDLAHKLRAQATYRLKPVSASKTAVAKIKMKPSSTITSGSAASNITMPKFNFKQTIKKSSVFDEEMCKQVVVSDEEDDVEAPEEPFATRKAAIEDEQDSEGYYKSDMMESIRRSLDLKEERNKLKAREIAQKEIAQGSPSSSGSGSGSETRMRNLERNVDQNGKNLEKIMKHLGIQ